MLKKITPITAIAFALMAAPAMAQTGHVGVAYTSNDDAEIDAYGVEGSTAFSLTDAIGLQIDGGLGFGEQDGDDLDGWDINAHLYYTAGAFRIGGLYGAAGASFDGGTNDPAASHWGVEGQYWFDRFAVGASAIWGEAEWIISPDLDYDNYDFYGDWYVTDNFVVGVNYGVGNLENSGGSEADTTSYGVNAEWQFGSIPLSLLAGYQNWEIDGVGVDTNALTVGARWNFGGSLIERDRAGFRNSPNGIVTRYLGF